MKRHSPAAAIVALLATAGLVTAQARPPAGEGTGAGPLPTSVRPGVGAQAGSSGLAVTPGAGAATSQLPVFTRPAPVSPVSTIAPPAPAGAGIAGLGAAPVVSVDPPSVTLSDVSSTLDLRVTGAPQFTGFELQIAFDPAIVAITGAIVDQMLASTGGQLISQGVQQTAAGQVTIAANISESEVVGPSGDGVLARITIYPLNAGSSTLSITRAELTPGALAEGGTITAATQPGEVNVAVQPPAAVQTEAAVALAGGGTSGIGRGLPNIALPTLELSREQLFWLVLLLGSAAVAVLGWLIGKRPAAPGRP